MSWSAAYTNHLPSFDQTCRPTVRSGDSEGREALVRYILRPPIAQDRVELLPGDLVRIRLRRPFRDGTVAVDLDPLSLLCRLAASVPPPHFHVVRYAGALAPASKLRPLVIPPPPPTANDDPSPCTDCSTTSDKPSTHRSGYRPWRELMLRSFAIDVEKCDRCGARLRLRALVLAAASIDRFLRRIGEPTEPPALSPARDPPFFKSRALRQRFAGYDSGSGDQLSMTLG